MVEETATSWHEYHSSIIKIIKRKVKLEPLLVWLAESITQFQFNSIRSIISLSCTIALAQLTPC